MQGEFGTSAVLASKALKIEPLATASRRNLADNYVLSGRFHEGIAIYEEVLARRPDVARINGRIANAYLAMGEYETARLYSDKEPVEWVRELLHIFLLARTASEQEWRAAARAYEEKWGAPNAFQLAEIYAWGGDADETFKWLAVAREIHDPGTLWSKVSLQFDAVKADPRWPEHLSAIGLID